MPVINNIKTHEITPNIGYAVGKMHILQPTAYNKHISAPLNKENL